MELRAFVQIRDVHTGKVMLEMPIWPDRRPLTKQESYALLEAESSNFESMSPEDINPKDEDSK